MVVIQTDFLNAIPFPVMYVDREFRFQSSNNAFNAWIGQEYKVTPGQPLSVIFGEQFFDRVRFTVMATGQTGEAFPYRLRRDGTYSPVEVFVTADVHEQDEVKGYTLVIQDVSHRRQRERHLQDYVDTAPIGLHWVNAEGIIIWANQAELDMLGYRADEYIGRHIGEFHATQEGATEILRRLAANDVLQQYEAAMVHRDGSIRDVLISSSVLWENGKFVHTRCFTQDITGHRPPLENMAFQRGLERLVAERTRELSIRNQELKASEERYHRMIEEVEDYAILLLSPEGIIENWNKGAEKIKGYTAEEAIGRSFRMFYVAADQERKLPDRLLQEAILKGKATHEGYRVRKDGTMFWGSILITTLHDDDGRVIGFSKVTRDLSERKKAQDAIQRKNEELEKMNQELSSFAYVSSHDLQEPLRKIRAFSSRILELDYDRLSEKGRDHFERIQRSAERMQALIEDLLSYSRTSTSDRIPEEINLQTAVTHVIDELAERIEEKRATIAYDDLPVIKGIPFQIHQLLVNLISNALKFSKLQEQELPRIEIRATLVPGSLMRFAKVDATRQYHCIAVADNGIGFEPEFRKKIFDIFQRLHHRDRYEGTGVGLAICRRIAENHEGFIEAQGVPGQGAVFQVYIPV
ncbi:PAS domain-containing sensor histidine kinase [Parachryseolinea silvisoli]|uniref:PAS domain-containing sensor histidine kinase n=1 Tax=Parachryseolinea silvisoli TaxID=2873601 RepID=UPI002265ED2D|nr:PAS domain S-box protein [Parachryseolinea silvisoli]MCD9014119.1 PAS domain S-box protein [Parachryseolinea silvisoli]